jgi:hypothetical protein
MLINDPRLRRTDATMFARALAAQGPGRTHQERMFLGFHGESPLLRLSYLSPVNACAVPVAHAGLMGVVKGLMSHALRKVEAGQRTDDIISASGRRQMRDRAGHVRVPHDYGRPYR